MSRKRDLHRAIKRKNVFKYGISWLLGQRLREAGKLIARAIKRGLEDFENRKKEENMKKEITKYYCDICNSEVKKEKLYEIIVPVLNMCEVDGKPLKGKIISRIGNKHIELCEECLKKVTVVRNNSTWEGKEYYIVEGGINE